MLKMTNIKSTAPTVFSDGTVAMFKGNLLERWGGDANFELLLVSFCERIQEDAFLSLIFGAYDLDMLVTLQRSLLLAAFVEPASEDEKKHLYGRVVFLFHELFEKGLNEDHFYLLQSHLLDALLDCWEKDDTFNLCKEYFDDLRQLFIENGNTTRQIVKNIKTQERMHGQEDDENLSMSFSMLLDFRRKRFDHLSKSERTRELSSSDRSGCDLLSKSDQYCADSSYSPKNTRAVSEKRALLMLQNSRGKVRKKISKRSMPELYD